MNLKQINVIVVLPLLALFIIAILIGNWILLGVIIIVYILYAIWYEGKRK